MSAGLSTSPRELILPANRFLWSVFDCSGIPAPRRLGSRRFRERCRNLAEHQLPCPIESLQVALVAWDDSRVIACAMPRSELQRLLSEAETQAGGSVISLSPDAVPLDELMPDAVPEGGALRPEYINLLVDDFQPAAIRIERRRAWVSLVAASWLAALLLVIGLEQRAAAHGRATLAVTSDVHRLVRETLGTPAAESNVSHQPPLLRLTAEARRLEAMQAAAPEAILDELDVVDHLARLLRRWPTGLHTTVPSLSATSTSVVLRCELPSEEVEALIEALAPWDGWRRPQPDFSTRQGVTSITCRFIRTVSTPDPSGKRP